MKKSKIIGRPAISRTAFRDVDFDKIDFEKDSVFVIGKVFNDSLREDVILIINFYGKERVKKDIVQVSYFDQKVFNFICKLFDIKDNLFESYKKRQESSQLRNY